MMTVAPPLRKPSAIALPATFVPPVTKTHLPLNSFGSGVHFDDAVNISRPSRDGFMCSIPSKRIVKRSEKTNQSRPKRAGKSRSRAVQIIPSKLQALERWAFQFSTEPSQRVNQPQQSAAEHDGNNV